MAWDETTDGAAIFTAYLFELLRFGAGMQGSWLRAANRLRLAAFDDNVTPDRTVPIGETVYGDPAGEWDATREVHSGAGSPWPAGGLRLAELVGGHMQPGAAGYPGMRLWSTPLVIAPVTLTGAVGTLLYDTQGSVPGMGVCYTHWAGGPWDVTNGMITVTWHPSGVCGITV